MATEQVSAEQAKTIRIFVGGVSESVSKDDLEKIFTQKSMGKVEHVDFVRTKGRSFAYVNFLPSDDHSLSKLLSMYNGCLWKGGKLKLEKAKENYLARLKREWSEDAENERSDLVDLGEKTVSSEDVKKVSETKQLHIFFPRLRKVKSVPFNGTGKHKYSFQRVDVPALPVHFCDCEEHNPPEPGKKNYASAHHDINKCFDVPEEGEGGGMNDYEVNIMTSVMDKLMQRGSNINSKKTGTELTKSGYDLKKAANVGDDSNKRIYGIQSNENVADFEGDEDNLIINITKREDTMSTSTRVRERKSISAKKRPRSDWMKSSIDEKQQDSSKAKRSDISSKSKTKVTHGKGDDSETALGSTGGKGILETGSTASMPLSFGIDTSEPDGQSTTGLSWSQKSSWKELVGTKSMGFNISQVLPVKAFIKESRPQPNTSTASISKDIEVNKDLQREEDFVEHRSSKIKEADNLVRNQIKKMDNLVENQTKESDELAEHQKNDSNVENQTIESGELVEQQINDSNVENQTIESDELVEHQRKDSNRLVDPLSIESAASSEKSGRGASWRQKSSWTQLVYQDSGLFSISQILPNANIEKLEEKSELLENSGLEKQDQSNFGQSGARNIEQLMEETPRSSLGFHDEEHGPAASESQMTPGQVEGKKSSPLASASSAPAKKTTFGNVEMGESCTFMRSAASLKEWAKSKTALSGSRKKKSTEK